jgi:MoxR-like ATPase
MTNTEALIELADVLGPRPIRVNTGNRNAVRKWLRLGGISSGVVEKLTTAELACAFNDTEFFTNLQAQAPATPRAPRAASPSVDSDALAKSIAAAVAGAMASMPAPSAELDEERIIELIQAYSAQPAVVTFEIRDSEGVRERITGLQHKQTPEVLGWLIAGVNVWLAGPAGSGKTTMAESCAKALGLEFYATGAIQNEYKLTGFVDAEGRTVRTAFREAFEHGGLFLWDEIDASNANALVAFNQALANEAFPFPDGMVKKHPDFIAVAAANTFGHGATADYVGRTRIDGATLDRFAQIEIDYDEALESELAAQINGAQGREWSYTVQNYRRAARNLSLRHLITPRASINGAKALRAGMNERQVINNLIRRGLDHGTWEKLEAYA